MGTNRSVLQSHIPESGYRDRAGILMKRWCLKGKIATLGLISALIALIGFNGCASVESMSKPIEAQFTVPAGEIHQLNIYANKSQTIKGSWKADKAVYRWWTNPSGVAYSLEQDNGKTLRVFQPTSADPEPGFLKDEKVVDHSMVGMQGGELSIKCGPPYGESGYYTICFMPYPYDTHGDVNIIIRYWLQ
jgi:hypothetical protein